MYAHPKVLVLSRDPDTHFLTETLAAFATVTKVESILEALDLAGRRDYDALFCDWELADGTWRTLLEELRQRRQEIPVIVFCHCGGEHEWTEVLKAGAFDFIAPPYTGRELMALIEHALTSSQKLKDCCLSA